VEHRRNAGRAGGSTDRDRLPPAGVPVDLASRKSERNDKGEVLKRGKESTVKALLATQRSTASLGKFDKMREGEPERKKANDKSKKRKQILGSSTDPKVMSTEYDRSMKLLKTVVNGGVQKEKDRKKGKLATGETAYDYDYNDGLGPSSFRKKKGRAGVGKLKKMTMKRAK
jgi:regulator of ribosome biosynthesis